MEETNEGNYNVKPVIVSALEAVRKSDGFIRLIHDCSLPTNSGVKSHSVFFEHYTYESMNDAIRLVKPGYCCAN